MANRAEEPRQIGFGKRTKRIETRVQIEKPAGRGRGDSWIKGVGNFLQPPGPRRPGSLRPRVSYPRNIMPLSQDNLTPGWCHQALVSFGLKTISFFFSLEGCFKKSQWVGTNGTGIVKNHYIHPSHANNLVFSLWRLQIQYSLYYLLRTFKIAWVK